MSTPFGDAGCVMKNRFIPLKQSEEDRVFHPIIESLTKGNHSDEIEAEIESIERASTRKMALLLFANPVEVSALSAATANHRRPDTIAVVPSVMLPSLRPLARHGKARFLVCPQDKPVTKPGHEVHVFMEHSQNDGPLFLSLKMEDVMMLDAITSPF